jgi:hypothetical protein
LCPPGISIYVELMSHPLVPALFVIVAVAVGMLIKWEFKRFQRRPRTSRAFNRHVEALRVAEPGRAYTAPPERTKRAFEPDSSRR